MALTETNSTIRRRICVHLSSRWRRKASCWAQSTTSGQSELLKYLALFVTETRGERNLVKECDFRLADSRCFLLSVWERMRLVLGFGSVFESWAPGGARQKQYQRGKLDHQRARRTWRVHLRRVHDTRVVYRCINLRAHVTPRKLILKN